MRSYDGISRVATGQLYPDYPRIFPNAIAQVVYSSPTMITLVVEPNTLQQIERIKSSWITSITSWVTSAASYGTKHPLISATAGVAALGGSWVVKSLAVVAADNLEVSMSTTAVAIGYVLYQRYGHSTIPTTQNRTFAAIQYSQDDDEVVQQELAKPRPQRPGGLVDNLDRAFRNYRLNVFSEAKLKEIIALLAKHQINGQGQENLPVLEKMKQLFAAGKAARKAIKNQKISVFIGQSGSGKTTTGNYLCGRTMKAIDPKFVRSDLLDAVIIAEDSLGDIGHKTGLHASETFLPQLFKDKDNEITYCDFPGLGDNRGTETVMCNSLTIIKVIKNAEMIQGFLFFINRRDLGSGKNDSVIKDMKVLQLLLRKFEPFKESVLFIITKAGGKETREQVSRLICTVLETATNNEDEELGAFVQEVLDSNVLKKRLVMCNPCNESVRSALIQQVKDLKPFAGNETNPRPPLTPEALRTLDGLERDIVNEVSATLINLKRELSAFWTEKINKNRTIDGAKVLFEKLKVMHADPLTINCLTEKDDYAQFPSIAKLTHALICWNKVTELTIRKNLSENVELGLREIKKGIDFLMFRCFVSSVKATLESYIIQENILDRSQELRIADLTTPQGLLPVVINLMQNAGAENFYGNELMGVLTEYNANYPEMGDLRTLIETNIHHPFGFITEDKRIEVIANGDKKIALSQVVKAIGHQGIKNSREMHIKVDTLYFDADLIGGNFKGKKIVIEAKHIIVIRPCAINLYVSPYAAGSLSTTSELQGSIKDVDDEKTSTLTIEPSTTVNAARLNYTW